MKAGRTAPRAEIDRDDSTVVAHRAAPEPLAYRPLDAAAAIGVSKATFWRLVAEGRLPTRKVLSATVVRRVDLEAFLNACPLGERSSGLRVAA